MNHVKFLIDLRQLFAHEFSPFWPFLSIIWALISFFVSLVILPYVRHIEHFYCCWTICSVFWHLTINKFATFITFYSKFVSLMMFPACRLYRVRCVYWKGPFPTNINSFLCFVVVVAAFFYSFVWIVYQNVGFVA